MRIVPILASGQGMGFMFLGLALFGGAVVWGLMGLMGKALGRKNQRIFFILFLLSVLSFLLFQLFLR